MTDSIISVIAAAGIVLTAFFGMYHAGTIHRLKNHQSEWNCKKQTSIESGLNGEQIEQLYLSYIEHLKKNRSLLFGACFPHK